MARGDHPGLCVIRKPPACLMVAKGAKKSTVSVSQFEHMWPSQGHRPASDNKIIIHHIQRKGRLEEGRPGLSDLPNPPHMSWA